VCTVSEIPADRWDKSRFWHPSQGVAGKTYTFAAGVVENVNDFDPAVFGLSRREAMAMDPQQRLLLSVTWRALEDACLSLNSLRGEVVGVYVGASSLDSANLSSEDPASGGPYFMTGNTLSIVANRISHIFGLNGPSLTIDTACSSSLVALDQAVRALERGEVDTAIVGGVNLLNHPLPFVGFAQARMLSPEGRCRAYDNDALGYVRAEGAVTIVLRRSDKAQAAGDRSRARIVASGVNSAGRTNGISLPSPEAQVGLLDRIYSEAGIDPNHIAFIEGHGTGTKVGDPAEVYAIGQVIGKRRRAPVPLGSIKSNIGHTEPASGLFGLLKAVMALENNYLPASLFFDTPNEHIDFADLNVRVTSTALELLRSRNPRLAGINSFGFGGTNAHVVICDPEPPKPGVADRGGDHYFVASAHTENALKQMVADYRDRMAEVPEDKADAIVAASAAGRSLMRHRLVVPARDGRQAHSALSAFLAGEAGHGVELGEAPGTDAKIAFVFAGNGAQWAGMGIDAYRENKTFRRHFDAASALFEAQIDEKLVDLLADEQLSERLSDTRIAQPLLFSIQVAIANCLLAAGVKPTHVFGHSIGEVAAAHIAGAMSLMDAVSVVAARSRSQHATRGRGTMAAALCGEEAAKAFLVVNNITDVVVAAVNARNSITFSGSAESLAKVRSLGRRAKIAVQPLDIEYPFHHPLIDDVKEEFLASLPKISLRAGEYGFLSTVTGGLLSGFQLDGDYWWRNAREPVSFRKAVVAALELDCNLFIEISPRAILTNYLKETVRELAANAQVITTLVRETNSRFDPVARSVARAFAYGADGIPGKRNAGVDLPVLPFEPETLTVPATSDTYDLFGRNGAYHSLAGWRVDPNGNAWKNHIDAALVPDLAQHVVEGRAIMPGAGFVEIALQVAQQYFRSDKVSLVNMELLHPLALDAKLLELSTVISPETGLIEIGSRERLTTDDWTLHAVARCQKFMEDNGANHYADIADHGTSIASERIYAIASDFGLDYGPVFRLLSEAMSDGKQRVDVKLAPSAAPAHPMMNWSVSPMSLDAAFHGLVGLFDQLSGETDGAPYIPVRFGSVDLLKPGAVICHARIEIQRYSAHSIKARFILCDDHHETVLRIEDCRFRRTWLRQHVALSSYGLHYETSPWSMSTVADVALPGDILPGQEAYLTEDSSLLLQAAIYRSCYDIARELIDRESQINLDRLPGDRALRGFLTTCLGILSEAGLAQLEGSLWRVEPYCDLPTVEELLRELQADRPDRGVEAVMVASIRSGVLTCLAKAGDEEFVAPSLPARSTLEHFRQHSPGADWRNRQVLAALRKIVETNPAVPLEVLQLGSTATGFTSAIAELVGRTNGRLVVYEPSEDLRRPLEMSFEQSGRVEIVSVLHERAKYHVVLSCADRLFSFLESDQSVIAAVQGAIAHGAALLAVESANGSISSFLLGLSPEWQANGALADFAAGSLGSVRDWQRLLSRLELPSDSHVRFQGLRHRFSSRLSAPREAGCLLEDVAALRRRLIRL
jgi:acyl transferase domain-containing protein